MMMMKWQEMVWKLGAAFSIQDWKKHLWLDHGEK